jgi:predicted porin
MKRILLGTTTLIGAASIFAGAAFADTPKVTVGGYENFEAGYVTDDMSKTATSTQNGVEQQPQAFRSDTQVDFKIDGKSDAGLGYGGEIDLLADTSADVQGRGVNASKTFIYVDGNWGRFEVGSNVGADGTLKVDAGTIARATGGIDGDWSYFAPAGTQFLAMSALPLAYGNLEAIHGVTATTGLSGSSDFLGNHTEENLSKITYYTPRWQGLQVGVSYLPDQINRGQGTFLASGSSFPVPVGPSREDNLDGMADNIFTGGINYDNKWGDFGLAVAATGEYGSSSKTNADDIAYRNLEAYNVGAKLSYQGFSVAGSYGNWGKSETDKASTDLKDTWYWDAGVGYEYGPFGVSVTYMASVFSCGSVAVGLDSNCYENTYGGSLTSNPIVGKNKFDSVSVGTDYKLAPGLTPYAEVTWFNENAVGTYDDNKGAVILLGTQLNF